MKAILTILSFSLMSVGAFATGSVSGNIQDKQSGEKLAGVEVSIVGSDITTYTDFDGNFSFEGLKPGYYKVKVNYISYEDELIKFSIQDNKSPMPMTITLEQK